MVGINRIIPPPIELFLKYLSMAMNVVDHDLSEKLWGAFNAKQVAIAVVICGCQEHKKTRNSQAKIDVARTP